MRLSAYPLFLFSLAAMFAATALPTAAGPPALSKEGPALVPGASELIAWARQVTAAAQTVELRGDSQSVHEALVRQEEFLASLDSHRPLPIEEAVRAFTQDCARPLGEIRTELAEEFAESGRTPASSRSRAPETLDLWWRAPAAATFMESDDPMFELSSLRHRAFDESARCYNRFLDLSAAVRARERSRRAVLDAK